MEPAPGGNGGTPTGQSSLQAAVLTHTHTFHIRLRESSPATEALGTPWPGLICFLRVIKKDLGEGAGGRRSVRSLRVCLSTSSHRRPRKNAFSQRLLGCDSFSGWSDPSSPLASCSRYYILSGRRSDLTYCSDPGRCPRPETPLRRLTYSATAIFLDFQLARTISR